MRRLRSAVALAVAAPLPRVLATVQGALRLRYPALLLLLLLRLTRARARGPCLLGRVGGGAALKSPGIPLAGRWRRCRRRRCCAALRRWVHSCYSVPNAPRVWNSLDTRVVRLHAQRAAAEWRTVVASSRHGRTRRLTECGTLERQLASARTVLGALTIAGNVCDEPHNLHRHAGRKGI